MTEVFTTGTWRAKPGQEDDFVAAWTDFASWASGFEGVGTLRLARDLSDPEQFVSFASWANIDLVHAWKGSPEFRERMARVQEHVAEFRPSELELASAVETRLPAG